jgi:hypothetical protein
LWRLNVAEIGPEIQKPKKGAFDLFLETTPNPA